jgi:hypothetical protein
VALGDGLGVPDTTGLGALGVGEGAGERDGVGELLGCGLRDGLGDGVGLGVCDGVGLGTEVGL